MTLDTGRLMRVREQRRRARERDRAERQRARELLQGLRCRAGGDRYWF